MDDLLAARSQMAMSLAFHIIFAAIGITMPLLMIVAEWKWLRTKDDVLFDNGRSLNAFGVFGVDLEGAQVPRFQYPSRSSFSVPKLLLVSKPKSLVVFKYPSSARLFPARECDKQAQH